MFISFILSLTKIYLEQKRFWRLNYFSWVVISLQMNLANTFLHSKHVSFKLDNFSLYTHTHTNKLQKRVEAMALAGIKYLKTLFLLLCHMHDCSQLDLWNCPGQKDIHWDLQPKFTQFKDVFIHCNHSHPLEYITPSSMLGQGRFVFKYGMYVYIEYCKTL